MKISLEGGWRTETGIGMGRGSIPVNQLERGEQLALIF